MDDQLPPHVRTYPIDQIYRHLKKYHGIAQHVASNRLHEIKDANRLPADFVLLFDLTGNVFRADDQFTSDRSRLAEKRGEKVDVERPETE